MEVGLGLQSDKRPEEYEAIARQAEAAGFDVISVFHDLLFQPAIVPLTVIAQATDRVRLGPAALNARTLHPVELAGQAAALDLDVRAIANPMSAPTNVTASATTPGGTTPERH